MYRERGMSRSAWGVVLFAGAVIILVGVNLMLACTAWSEDLCVDRAYGPYGFAIVFAGGIVALVGLASLLSAGEHGLPPEIRFEEEGYDPVVVARGERLGSILFVAICGAILVAAEAFPIYSLYLQTATPVNPSFDPTAFAVDVGVFAVADAVFLLFLWLYVARD